MWGVYVEGELCVVCTLKESWVCVCVCWEGGVVEVHEGETGVM